MIVSCASCKFWTPEQELIAGVITGPCRRRSPAFDNGRARWPETTHGDACGDHETLLPQLLKNRQERVPDAFR